jgi:hypothetical protein
MSHEPRSTNWPSLSIIGYASTTSNWSPSATLYNNYTMPVSCECAWLAATRWLCTGLTTSKTTARCDAVCRARTASTVWRVQSTLPTMCISGHSSNALSLDIQSLRSYLPVSKVTIVLENNNRECAEHMLELHRDQGMDIYWRDTVQCPSESEYRQMVQQSKCTRRPLVCSYLHA